MIIYGWLVHDYAYRIVSMGRQATLFKIKGLRPLPPTPVERMDRGSLNRTSATELPAPTEKHCGRFKLDVQRQRQYFCER